jgi:hypothetical protein
MEEELPELHGPCDRFAAPPDAPSNHANSTHQPDHPDRQEGAAGREYWGEADEECEHSEVSGPPAEECDEPASLDADPCGDAPSSGEQNPVFLCTCS